MKRIFLTGASSGIGLAIARALAARGDEVWGTSREVGRLPTFPRFHPVTLDLLDDQSIDRAFAVALDEAGCFDVLINNAGSGHFGATETLSAQTVAEQFQILLFAQIQLTRLGLVSMRKGAGGLIINVTSLAAQLPIPFMAAYNAAKAAFAVFTMTIQLELPDSKVRIVDLQPADICTDFNDAVRKETSDHPGYATRADKIWKAVDRNMKSAPSPDLVARRVCALIDRANPPPRLAVGAIFQARIAPLILRFLPQRLLVWGIKKYYGL